MEGTGTYIWENPRIITCQWINFPTTQTSVSFLTQHYTVVQDEYEYVRGTANSHLAGNIPHHPGKLIVL